MSNKIDQYQPRHPGSIDELDDGVLDRIYLEKPRAHIQLNLSFSPEVLKALAKGKRKNKPKAKE
jgi:hypothetical protein